jgi:hypothetical protein
MHCVLHTYVLFDFILLSLEEFYKITVKQFIMGIEIAKTY